jgi:signal peptidase I
MMKLLQHILYGTFFLLLVALGLLFVAPPIPGVPAIEVKIVQSGSMEPSIMTGGIVVLSPASAYQTGDVITFTDTTASIPTTHRIVETYVERGETWFVTKGDANESLDASPVAASAVLGKVFFTVPFVGFVLDFARQPIGFALLIVLPALLIILGEMDKIVREIRGRQQPATRCPFIPTFQGVQVVPIQYRRQPVRMMDIGVPARTGFDTRNTLDLSNCLPRSREALAAAKRHWFPDWALAFILVGSSSMFAAASFIPYTASYFSDSVVSAGNVFRAGFFAVEPPQFIFTVEPEENVCIDIKKPQGNDTSTAIPQTFSISDLPEDTSYTVSMSNILKPGTNTPCTSSFEVRILGQADATWSTFALSTTSSSLALNFLYKSNAANDSCSADMVFSATHAGVTYATSKRVEFYVGNNSPTGQCLTGLNTQSTSSNRQNPNPTVEVEPRPLSTGAEVVVEEVDEITVETFEIVETETDEEGAEDLDEELVDELVEVIEEIEVERTEEEMTEEQNDIEEVEQIEEVGVVIE